MFCTLRYVFFFFFKQKTAYEMRTSDWSSDVCSSDLIGTVFLRHRPVVQRTLHRAYFLAFQIIPAFYARPLARHNIHAVGIIRSEERRVGKECVSTCRSRWSPYH